MSEPVLVRGEISRSVYWSRILVPLCLLGTVALLLFGDRTAGILLTGLFGLIWIALETYAAVLRSKQMWIRDTGDGFDVINRKQEFHVPDNSVTSLALKTKRNYAGGELKSIFRQFVIWSDEEDGPITLETTLVDKWPDPLATLTARLWKQVLEHSKSALQAGRPFDGDGWRLDVQEFTWGKPAQQQSVARLEITACEEFDGQICIWRRGQDDAVAKFPTNGRNVCLLPQLLESPEKPAGAAAEEETAGLGRILFERRARRTPRLLAYAGGGLLVFIGGVLLIVEEIEAKVTGVGMIAVGVLCLVWAYSMAYSVFRCRERGVHKSGLFGQQELRYVDVGTFTYSATRHYHNGVYVGTHIGLHFVPLPEVKAAKINYTTTIMNEDASLDELRNFIAKAIAVRMASRLAAGEAVPWTQNLTLLPNGIQFRPQGFIGRKAVQTLPFENYGGQNLEQGVFYLFRQGEKKPVMSEQVSAPNFFPGYFLLLMLQSQ